MVSPTVEVEIVMIGSLTPVGVKPEPYELAIPFGELLLELRLTVGLTVTESVWLLV